MTHCLGCLVTAAGLLLAALGPAAGLRGACTNDCGAADLDEGEPCLPDGAVDETNGGCGVEPPLFSTLLPPATVCGTASTYLGELGPARDTDWYLLDQPSLLAADADGDGVVHVRAELRSEFPGVAFIVDPGAPPCAAPVVVGRTGFSSPACGGPEDVAAQAVLLVADHPGGIAVFVSTGLPDGTGIFEGFDCETGLNDYRLSVQVFDALLQPEVILPEDGDVVEGIALIVADQTSPATSFFDMASAVFEYSADGVNWVFIAEQIDLDETHAGVGGFWDTTWDTGLVEPGTYQLRVTLTSDDGDVATSPPVQVTVNRAPVAAATATPAAPLCPWDCADPPDGVVGILDFLALLAQWGTPGACDFDGEGVGILDFLALLAAWGPCEKTGALVTFDGSASVDADGEVVAWFWEFGDGTVGSGPVVDHLYQDASLVYPVVLTVEDDLGGTASEFYELSFAPFLFRAVPQSKCTCTSITLRGDDLPAEATALGADGKAGGTDWSKWKTIWDGKTLGPLGDNPENADVGGGEKKATGYAFEVLVEVNGDPARCKEIQVIRRTACYEGVTQQQCDKLHGTYDAATSKCTLHKRWKGAKQDMDLDGTNDISVGTMAECVAAGGTWNAATMKCTLEFPESGSDFGPDERTDDETKEPEGAYEKPWLYKKHTSNHKIVWGDPPKMVAANNGSTYAADFIAIVRGTDGNYCYVAFTVSATKKAGDDEETLTETDSGVGAGSVPGVP